MYIVFLSDGSIDDEISRKVKVIILPQKSIVPKLYTTGDSNIIFFRDESKYAKRQSTVDALMSSENRPKLKYIEESDSIRADNQESYGSLFKDQGLDFREVRESRNENRSQRECGGPVVMAPGTVGIARNCSSLFLWGVQVKLPCTFLIHP